MFAMRLCHCCTFWREICRSKHKTVAIITLHCLSTPVTSMSHAYVLECFLSKRVHLLATAETQSAKSILYQFQNRPLLEKNMGE